MSPVPPVWVRQVVKRHLRRPSAFGSPRVCAERASRLTSGLHELQHRATASASCPSTRRGLRERCSGRPLPIREAVGALEQRVPVAGDEHGAGKRASLRFGLEPRASAATKPSRSTPGQPLQVRWARQRRTRRRPAGSEQHRSGIAWKRQVRILGEASMGVSRGRSRGQRAGAAKRVSTAPARRKVRVPLPNDRTDGRSAGRGGVQRTRDDPRREECRPAGGEPRRACRPPRAAWRPQPSRPRSVPSSSSSASSLDDVPLRPHDRSMQARPSGVRRPYAPTVRDGWRHEYE